MGQLAHGPEPVEVYVSKSPKMQWLLSELVKIRSLDQKVIIFMEYRDTQRLIQHYVQEVCV
jgi:ERCC4-related helicase